MTMLVLTGLAGRLHSNILTTKERHNLVSRLKASKTDFLKSLEGLSARQLDFRCPANKLSVRECAYRLVSVETELWSATKSSLKQQNGFLQRTFSNDATLTSVIGQNSFPFRQLKFKSLKAALALYKEERNELLRYVQTSTENVRDHMGKTDIGNFDAYQLMLLNTLYSEHFTQQIENIKNDPLFPL